jgi:L-proline amide hydrolase
MSAIPEPSRTGTVEFDGHRTWYRVTGELDPESPRAPLLVVHGGPGAAHDYCLAMTSLAGDDRAVVHYDQLGCGRSTHLPDADPGYWTVGLFVRELRTVVDALGIGDRFHLLGRTSSTPDTCAGCNRSRTRWPRRSPRSSRTRPSTTP